MSVGVALTIALVAMPAIRSAEQFTTKASQEDSARMLQSFADCIVLRRSQLENIQTWLRSSYDDTEQNRLIPKIATRECLPKSHSGIEMRLPKAVLRALLYDALYRARFKAAATDFSEVAPLDIDSEFDGPPSASDRYFRSVGDCMARRVGAQSQQLLLTRAGSEAESSAFDAITPDLPDCVPEGNKLAFSKPVLRGLIAEAMLKLTTAAAALPKSTN